MSDLNWRDAIIRVLEGSPEAMHYLEISEAIAEQQLRSEFGATPAATVNSIISTSLQNERSNSPFIRVDRGRYWLRRLAANPEEAQVAQQLGQPVAAEPDETGLINAFGMYWSRNNVLWTSAPKILGQQQPGSTSVDFCNQKGVYLLHDGHTVVYVGRTTDQPLGVRLRQHIVDRLNGRWDRFSWFGVYSVVEDGALNTAAAVNYDLTLLIVTMEALLIEGLNPHKTGSEGTTSGPSNFFRWKTLKFRRPKLLS